MNDENVFLQKYISLCKRYKKAIVPMYEGKVSLHDPMQIVEMDEDIEAYITRRIYTNQEIHDRI